MTEITEELAELVIRDFGLDRERNLPKPIQDASSGNALSKKGGGRALGGGGKRARATAQQGEEACEPMGKGKMRGTKAPPVGGREGTSGGTLSPVAVSVTTTRKDTRYRIYRVVPLLAVVVEDEGH